MTGLGMDRLIVTLAHGVVISLYKKEHEKISVNPVDDPVGYLTQLTQLISDYNKSTSKLQ